MLDDLKKDRLAGFGAQEKLKLSLYVGVLLVLGASIWMGSQCSSRLESIEDEPLAPAVEEARPAGPTLDPVELDTVVRASGAEPDRWSEEGIALLRRIQRRGSLGPLAGRVEATTLAAAKAPAGVEGSLRGRYLELRGRVTEVAREVYRPGQSPGDGARLWTLTLEGEDGTPFVAIKHALASEVGEGPPMDRKPPQVKAERIQKDHWVLLRGVYLQDRVGTFGDIQLNEPTPVVYATAWRIVFPPDQHNPKIDTLDDALWSEVRDRFMAESRNWEEDAVYETLRWARQQGHEKIAAQLESGELPWEAWDGARFDAWREEVEVDADTARPLTEASRGRIFRISGIVAEVLQFGWDRIPRNPWGVDEFQVLTMLADHYQTVAFRSFLPYPIESIEGVTGDRKEHLYVYGVFVKNLTYDTKFQHEDGSGRQRPITMPMFVVIHAEPYPEGAAAERIRATMVWVAAGMVLFGLLFYLVLIRGARRQEGRMEAHRLELRKRARAAGQGVQATAPPGGPGEGDPPDG